MFKTLLILILVSYITFETVSLKPFIPVGSYTKNITKFKEIISTKETLGSNTSNITNLSNDKLYIYAGPFTYIELLNKTLNGKIYESEVQIDNLHKFIKQQLDFANQQVQHFTVKIHDLLDEALKRATFNAYKIKEQINNFVSTNHDLSNDYQVQSKVKNLNTTSSLYSII